MASKIKSAGEAESASSSAVASVESSFAYADGAARMSLIHDLACELHPLLEDLCSRAEDGEQISSYLLYCHLRRLVGLASAVLEVAGDVHASVQDLERQIFGRSTAGQGSPGGVA
jgi:hypothetical protein